MLPSATVEPGQRAPRSSSLKGLWVLPILLLPAAGAAVLLAKALPAKEPLPEYGVVPAFSLTSQDGQAFGSAQLAGRPWVANFVFTRCTGVCPPFTAKMAAIQKGSARFGGLNLVSFTVDPEYDTPERLEAYGTERQADFSRWTFLTGERAALEAVIVKGLFQPVDRGDGSLLSLGHSSRFVLVDARGHIRGFYPSEQAGAVDRVLEAARQLVDEASP